MVVRFVDIGGIVYHHCLRFLFITNTSLTGALRHPHETTNCYIFLQENKT